MTNKKYFLLFLFTMFVVIIISCSSKSDVQPRMIISGYRAELLFADSFNTDLSQWKIEGEGTAQIISEGKLSLSLKEGSKGAAFWALPEFKGDIQLEYKITMPDSNGLFITILCAHGLEGEDIFTELPLRNGELHDYSRGQIRSYHISAHCFTVEGEHKPGSKIRKNPGHLLLARSNIDPCSENRSYYVDVVKIGSRIKFFVDDVLVHDYRDRAGFGPVYTEGRIGIWFTGNPEKFSIELNDFKVFKIISE